MRTGSFLIAPDPRIVPAALRGGHVAIGNFDGVHRGHQAVLAAALEPAHAAGRPAVALTFEPHPRSFFRPDETMFRLTPSGLKTEIFERVGLDGAVILPFDAELAGQSAEDFVRDTLVAKFEPKAVVVGYDFHFGKGREGSPQRLTELGRIFGLPTIVVDPVGVGSPVSSSAIRRFLGEGRIRQANELLGYRWKTEGIVSHGAKRGRDLGYPTANLELDPGCGLAFGIYAVRARVEGLAGPLGGVASFGRRPMFDNGAALLEVFLFDFSGDLYGRRMEVEFVDFIRPELRFDSIEALLQQMERDSAAARASISEPADPFAPSLFG